MLTPRVILRVALLHCNNYVVFGTLQKGQKMVMVFDTFNDKEFDTQTCQNKGVKPED